MKTFRKIYQEWWFENMEYGFFFASTSDIREYVSNRLDNYIKKNNKK